MTGELVLAFSAGTLSFFAPCAVPLVPAYVAYLGGAALPDIQRDPGSFQRRIVGGGVLYVLGFGLVFIALGLAAGLVGAGAQRQAALLQRVGGVLVVVMGHALLGWPHPVGFQPVRPARAGGGSAGTEAHTVTAGDGRAFDSPVVNPGETYKETFTQAGGYPYHCSFHRWMTGTVTVGA